MRDKIDYLFRNAPAPQAEYEKVAAMPDRITRGKLGETYTLEGAEAGGKAAALAIEVRSMARLGAKNLENRRKERRIRVAMEEAAGKGEVYDGVGEEDGEHGDGEDDGEESAIDPNLMDVEQAEEAIQGDLEADDDEDADADLEAVGNLEEEDGEDGQQDEDVEDGQQEEEDDDDDG